MKYIFIALILFSFTSKASDSLEASFSEYENKILKQLKTRKAPKEEYYENYALVSQKLYEREYYERSLFYFKKALQYKDKIAFLDASHLCFLYKRNKNPQSKICYIELLKDKRISSLNKTQPNAIINFYLNALSATNELSSNIVKSKELKSFKALELDHLLNLHDAVVLFNKGQHQEAYKSIENFPENKHDYESVLIQDIIIKMIKSKHKPNCLKHFKNYLKDDYYTINMCKDLKKLKVLSKKKFFSKYSKLFPDYEYPQLRSVILTKAK